MSLYNIDGEEVNTLYDIDGNQVVTAYDIDGNLIPLISFRDSALVTDVFTSTISVQPQGGCIDDDGNVYVCFYHAGKMLRHNIITGAELETSFTPDAYGHANGMAYNPTTDRLYLASMNTTGEVYVFDKSFNLLDTLYARNDAGNIFTCWNIAYDRKRNRFISMSGNKMMFFDNEFNFLSYVPYVSSEIWPYTAQDIETDGDFVYAVGWDSNHISVVGMNGDLVKMIANTAYTGEPESLCYDWMNGKYYMEGKNSSNRFVIREEIIKNN